MANPASEISFVDRQILSLLPAVGEKLGPHELSRTVKALVEDLGYQYTSDEVSGFLRGMKDKNLTQMFKGRNKNINGWQATESGRQAIEVWDSLLVQRLLQVARKSGDGLAKVHLTSDGPPIAYVVTPERFERMADDPSASVATVIANKEEANV